MDIDTDEEDVCSICFDTFRLPIGKTLPCLHIYCLECIALWRVDHNTCPMCRGTVDNVETVTVIEKKEETVSDTEEEEEELLPCPHKGCSTKCMAEILDNHIHHCVYNPIALVRQTQQEINTLVCSWRTVKKSSIDALKILLKLQERARYDYVETFANELINEKKVPIPYRQHALATYLRSLNEQGLYKKASDTYYLHSCGPLWKEEFVQVEHAVTLIGCGDYKDAEKILENIPEEVQREYPANICTVKAMLYKKQGEYRKARRCLDSIPPSSLDNSEFKLVNHIVTGDVYRKEGDLNAAHNAYSYVLEHAPPNSCLKAEAYYGFAKGEEQLSNYRSAARNYDLAIKALPASSPVLGIYKVCLADARRKMSHYALAEQDYLTGIQLIQDRLNPQHVELIDAYIGLGLILKKFQEYDDALLWYAKAQELALSLLDESHPKVAIIYKQTGDVYRKCGQNHEALHCFSLAKPILEKCGGLDYADLLHDKGRAHLEAGHLEDAIIHVFRAIRIVSHLVGEEALHEKKGSYLSTKALCLGLSKDYEGAEACFEEALPHLLHTVGEEHTETADLYLDRIRVRMRRMSEGDVSEEYTQSTQQLCIKAKEILSVVYGVQHPKCKDLETKIQRCQTYPQI